VGIVPTTSATTNSNAPHRELSTMSQTRTQQTVKP
jgi:hypothetical protein